MQVGPEQDQRQLLERGTIDSSNLSLWGSNYTFLVMVRDGFGRECRAVYKPRDGEAPLWDFPYGTLYKREYAAYLLSQVLGWNFIPFTLIRDGPHGIGSLQLYVEHDPRATYFTLRESYGDPLMGIACFDLVTNNADRKADHCILDGDGKVWGIDHGLTFHQELKLRTVIWDFTGQPIPPGLLSDMVSLEKGLANPSGMLKEMVELLEPWEVTALSQRVGWLLGEGIFPGLYRRRR